MSHERRPRGGYYETRTDLLSQGDIFRDVPLAYPVPAGELAVATETEGARVFLSGPLDFGLAMLITPTCSMRAQGGAAGYGHRVRTLVPLRTVTELEQAGILDPAKRGLAERRDSLINYMWIPGDSALGIEDSLALLYMPVTLHHDMIAENRLVQMTYEAAQQLQKKLAWYATSMLLDRADFDPPME